MPELPEVETVRRGLTPALEGARLSGLKLNRANLRYPFPERFAERLEGATVLRLERRAKYLLFYLDTQSVWVTHLGMTGRFQVTDIETRQTSALDGDYYHALTPASKHLHVQVIAEKEGAEKEGAEKEGAEKEGAEKEGAEKDRVRRLIDYYDPRRFGFMLLLSLDDLHNEAWYKGLGIEPLSPGFDGAWLYRVFNPRKLNLKTLLMDQRLIAGLGNIYVCEALWRAELSPDALGSSLTPNSAARLAEAVHTVLEEAVAAGGSSISDFASASGELGYFQHRFKVYDRKGKPCLRPGCAGHIARKVHAGRSSFYCELCQA